MLNTLGSVIIGSIVLYLSFVQLDAQTNSRHFMDEIWQKKYLESFSSHDDW